MLRLAVIPGDGIGPEVIEGGIEVLRQLEEMTDLRVEMKFFPHGANHYLETDEILSDETIEDLRRYDAIYFGAIGDPRIEPGLLEQGIILHLRFSLDLYVNLRPVKLLHKDFSPLKKDVAIDMVVIRENTEGLYSGVGGFLKRGTEDEVAIQEMVNTYKGVERIIDYAFEYARKNHRQRVTLCDKANVLTYAHNLWQRVFKDKREEYPEITGDHLYVDAMTMKMVKDPELFDVIVTCNLFGDIITDLGAELQGGMGMAASANIHPGRVGLFEPVHGSAPDIVGEDKANPMAAILALSMLLKENQLEREALMVEEAVISCLKDGVIPLSMGGEYGCKKIIQEIRGRL